MKTITLSLVGILLIGGVYLAAQESSYQEEMSGGSINNVTMENGKQVISITARGGYSPKISVAKADIPTTIRMKTQGAFDCSSSVVIPSIGYQGYLPPTGETNIEVPAQKAGTTLQGMCGMGMYRFQIQFS
ncbi:MAG: cupredoxin domain-containing protein [Candidatus Peregrinibacteria bacterium]|nr:cupredoxin domain-containing protein [Candidatus Peregrinibacteria bacterium]